MLQVGGLLLVGAVGLLLLRRRRQASWSPGRRRGCALHLRRQPRDIHCRLPQGLGTCRVRVAGQGNVFGAGAELHGFHAAFANDLADTGTHQMHPQDFVGVLVGQDLGEPLGLVVDLGATVGGKGEFADLVGAALRP